MWRCLNNVFGYCSGEPKFDMELHPFSGSDYCIDTCKLKPEICGQFMTQTQQVAIAGYCQSSGKKKTKRQRKVRLLDD